VLQSSRYGVQCAIKGLRYEEDGKSLILLSEDPKVVEVC
jgi:hypothetical protein